MYSWGDGLARMADMVWVTQQRSRGVQGEFRKEVGQRQLQCKVAWPLYKDDISCLDDSTCRGIKQLISSTAIVPNQDVLD